MTSTSSAAKRKKSDRAKAVRALQLYNRGHSLKDIADMCGIPTGSVTRRIELGRRILEAGLL